MEKYKKTIGFFGEELAKNFLIRRGYKIIASNLKFKKLEIDIITKKDKQIIFIEVKTRNSQNAGPAEDALKNSQIKDLKRAISAYCSINKINPNYIRLDFIAIDLIIKESKAKIKHFKNIF